MPIMIKQFSGAMDLDSPNETMPANTYREAWNGRFNGPKGNEVFQGVEGNTLIDGQDSLTDGTDVTIGRWYDAVYARIFFFNYNPGGAHGIYIYNTRLKTFQTLIKNGFHTDGNILNFSADSPIGCIGMLYGDPQEGNILCFLDSAGKPSKINVERYLANTYPMVEANYLNVIKAPPVFPPQVVYENDDTVNNNNLVNSLFKFAYSYIYDDNDQSVLSSGSIVPLPGSTFNGSIDTSTAANARIAIYLNTGPTNVKKIRLYMKQTQNGATSDWLEVDTIVKDAGSIPDNDQYKYLFYNGGNYTPIDQAYATLLFDYVPDGAGTQAILNGNVLAYGNIVEGEDWLPSSFSTSLVDGSAPATREVINGHLFFAYNNGVDAASGFKKITIVLTGVNVNNSATSIADLMHSAAEYYVNADSGGSDISFSITGNSSRNVATILFNLRGAATSAGWIFISNDTNSLTLYYPGDFNFKSTFNLGVNQDDPDRITVSDIRFAHYEGSNYSYGIIYLDENGKNQNGVITDITANITTIPSNSNFDPVAPPTIVRISLNAIIPPPWAVSYSIVRTDTLTYSKYLNWVSNRTLSGTGTLVDTKYAYIDISNIDQFNEQEQSTNPVVSYGFDQGDRIRFTALYKIDGTIDHLANKDYSIVGFEIDPVVNGQPQIGRYIKILYPSSDIDHSNFDFTGDPDYDNYIITLYHIASNTAPQTENNGTDIAAGNVYYEIGYKFGIGNPGQNTAYHFGNIADNQVSIQPGDIFFRSRTIPCANTFYIDVSADSFVNNYVTAEMIPRNGGTVFVGPYQISSQSGQAAEAFHPLVYPTFSDGGGLFLSTSATAYNLRIRGNLQVQVPGDSNGTWWAILIKKCNPAQTVVETDYILRHSDGIPKGQSLTISFDQTITVQGGWKAWFIEENGASQIANPTGFTLRVDVIRQITMNIYDKSYSDKYNMVTNADNRPIVEDRQAKKLQYGTSYRWSEEDQLNSLNNNSNRFYFINSDETVKSYGDIMKMTVLGKLLHIFHYRKCGTVGIYQKWVKTNSGSDQLLVNETLIEKNNIRYEIYEGGCGNQASSVVISNYAHYFIDPVRGYILRWSNDGVVLLSVLYRVQAYAATLSNYLDDYQYQFGGISRILGAFVVVDNNNALYLMMAQGGISASTGATIDGSVLSFDESDNSFQGFSNINADAILTSENRIYTWSHGKLYIHADDSPQRTFFGVTYPMSIDMIFNEKAAVKKSFMALSYQSNRFFIAPNIGDITTSNFNQQTGLQQESQLIDQDFEIQENIRYAALLRDANSGLNRAISLLEGDFLKGNWIEIRLEYAGQGEGFLFAPYIVYGLSNRNF